LLPKLKLNDDIETKNQRKIGKRILYSNNTESVRQLEEKKNTLKWDEKNFIHFLKSTNKFSRQKPVV